MSYIPQLQKHLIKLNNKRQALGVIGKNADKFIGLPEHESVSQMIAITDLQIDYGKKALIF